MFYKLPSCRERSCSFHLQAQRLPLHHQPRAWMCRSTGAELQNRSFHYSCIFGPYTPYLTSPSHSVRQENIQRLLEIIAVGAESIDDEASREAHGAELQVRHIEVIGSPSLHPQHHQAEQCSAVLAAALALPSGKGVDREAERKSPRQLKPWASEFLKRVCVC